MTESPNRPPSLAKLTAPSALLALLALLGTGPGACQHELGELPEGARVLCSTRVACPAELVCNTAVGICVAGDVDRTAPDVVAGSVRLSLSPPAGCPLPEVAALNREAWAELELAATKPLSEPPDVEMTGPGGAQLHPALLAEDGNVFRFAVGVPVGAPDGHYEATATLRDAALNEVRVDLGPAARIRVDTTHPPPLPEGWEETVELRRAPWGEPDAGGAARCEVVVTPGSLPAGERLLVFDQVESAGRALLASEPLDADGGGVVELPGEDRAQVAVALSDEACNPSGEQWTPQPVRRVRWTVVPSGFGTRAAPPSGGGMSERLRFVGGLVQDEGVAPLSLGSTPARTTSVGTWQREGPNGTTFPARETAALVYEATTASLWVLGGVPEVGRYCAPASTECRSLLRWDGLRWSSTTPRAAGSGELPDVTRSEHNGAPLYDPHRGHFVYFDALRDTTWELREDIWFQVTPSDPEEDGNPRDRARVGDEEAALFAVGGVFHPGSSLSVTFVWELRPLADGQDSCPGDAPPTATRHCEEIAAWGFDGVSWRDLTTGSLSGPVVPGDDISVVWDDVEERALLLAQRAQRYVGPVDDDAQCEGLEEVRGQRCYESLDGAWLWQWTASGGFVFLGGEEDEALVPEPPLSNLVWRMQEGDAVVLDGALRLWSWSEMGWTVAAAPPMRGAADEMPESCLGLAYDSVRSVVLALDARTEEADAPGERCESGVPADDYGQCSTLAVWSIAEDGAWTRLDHSDPQGLDAPRDAEVVAHDPTTGHLIVADSTLELPDDDDDLCRNGLPPDDWGLCEYVQRWEFTGSRWRSAVPDDEALPQARRPERALALVPDEDDAELLLLDLSVQPPDEDGRCPDGDGPSQWTDTCNVVGLFRWEQDRWQHVRADADGDGAPSLAADWVTEQLQVVWDPSREVAVLIDHTDNETEVWELDGLRWSRVPLRDPEGDGHGTARSGRRGAYDGAREAVVLLEPEYLAPESDGSCAEGYLADESSDGSCLAWSLYAYDGVSWTAERLSGPEAWTGAAPDFELLATSPDGAGLFGYGESGRAWTIRGDSWAPLLAADMEQDGGPHGYFYSSDGIARDPLSGRPQVLVNGELWTWHPAAEALPAQVLELSLAAAHEGDDASLSSLEVEWTAGGEGGASGAALLAWNLDRWQLLDDTTAPTDAPGPLRWDTSASPLLSRLARGSDRAVTFAVVPARAWPPAALGSVPASVQTDGVVVRVRYEVGGAR